MDNKSNINIYINIYCKKESDHQGDYFVLVQMLYSERFATVIVMIIVEYAFAVAVASKMYRRHIENNVDNCDDDKILNRVVRSVIGDYVLVPIRLLFALYFFSVGLLWHTILYPHSWHYFTNWNMFMIVLYFGLTNFSLALSHNIADNRSMLFGTIISKLFVVVATSSIFTTAVTFALISDRMDFWNVVMHLTTSICIFIEMSLNCIVIHSWDYIFCLTWSIIYLLVVWVAVGTGLKEWPYDFLRIDSPSCFIWYTALLLGNVLFFAVVWLYCHVKHSSFVPWCRGGLWDDRVLASAHDNNEDIENIELATSSLGVSCASRIWQWCMFTCVERQKVNRFQRVPLPADENMNDSDYLFTL
jgi:hypothetical protein